MSEFVFLVLGSMLGYLFGYFWRWSYDFRKGIIHPKKDKPEIKPFSLCIDVLNTITPGILLGIILIMIVYVVRAVF